MLQLVAEGHTNREIGDQLFISEKTVSVHVSNAMAKLGALSRYEAAARGRARGACSETQPRRSSGGRTFRNSRYISRSYRILKPPAR